MANKLTPLKSTGEFLKNVAGTPYHKAKRSRELAEKYLPGKIEKVKAADALLLKELLHNQGNPEATEDINKRMDVLERTISKYQQNLSDARHKMPSVEQAAKDAMHKSRKQLAVGSAAVAGTLGAGIAAKKIYDKHKAKKEAEKTAFEMLDEMVMSK